MKQLYALAIVVFSSIFLLTGCFNKQREEINREFDKSLYESLFLQNQFLNTTMSEGDFDVVLGISDDGLKQIASVLEGVEVRPKVPPKGFPDAYMKIISADIKPTVAETRLNLKIELVSKKRAVRAIANARGALLFDNQSDTDHLNFDVKIRSLRTGFKFSFISIPRSKLLDEYITIKTISELEDSLKIELPTIKQMSETIGISDQTLISDEDTGASATLNFSSPPFEVSLKPQIQGFVFNESGISLVASLDAESNSLAVAPSIPEADVPSEIRRLRSEIQSTVFPELELENSVELLVRKSGLEKIFSKYNQLEEQYRTISVNSTAVSGKLFEDVWKDNILGDGGVFAELSGHDAIAGRIMLSGISHSLNESGLSYSLNGHVVARAHVKTRFDPLVGGGIGKNWTLKGDARPRISGSLGFQLEDVADKRTVFLKNTLVCDKFPIEVVDSGALEIGVRLSEHIGDEKPTFTPLFSSFPEYVDMSPKEETSQFVLSFPGPYLRGVYEPVEVQSRSDSISAKFDLKLDYVSEAEDKTEFDTALDQVSNELEELQSKPACPEKDSLKVLIAGQDFGENNEFVKVVNFLVDGVKNGVEDIEDGLKKREKNLLRPDKGTAMHKPLHKPADTVVCIVTLFNDC